MAARALTTYYRGYKFRSRLEARWAVFFDSIGLNYLYEPEGYEVADGVYYLPDFLLNSGIRLLGNSKITDDVWVEIKPKKDISDDERQKIAEFVRGSGKTLLLIAGDPDPEAVIRLIQFSNEGKLIASEVMWIAFPNNTVGLIKVEKISSVKKEENIELVLKSMKSTRIIDGFKSARSARFEQLTASKICARCEQSFKPRKDYYNLCYACYQKQRRKDKASNIEIDPEALNILRLVFVVALIAIAVFLLVWGAYQIINIPNTLFKTEEPAPVVPTIEDVPKLLKDLPAVSIEVQKDYIDCDCSKNVYDCKDFDSQQEAQHCYELCLPEIGDIHFLDTDGDKLACESLTNNSE